MTKETLKKWERVERTHQGSWTVSVVSGRAIIQCAFCPEGRYFNAGEAGYYIAPDSRVLIIAIEDTELKWKSAYMYGFGGEVSRKLTGGAR